MGKSLVIVMFPRIFYGMVKTMYTVLILVPSSRAYNPGISAVSGIKSLLAHSLLSVIPVKVCDPC